ncbi:4Fe-4S cluster-binding domain-containing protein [Lentibacillus salinarum]|uniref:4Fe-4S cluster-binding domain-containing protein n=1 Tax=Lentibacillus salinarum TaxID=446820 RepID=A0ABW3ZSG0_9BACI
MKFYNRFIRTFQDVPEHTTLLIHSLSGCLLHCYGCHNYEEIIARTPREHKTKEDLYLYLKKSGFLFDAVMFSGGEFLIDKLDEITDLLQVVRNVFTGRIVIATCGVYNKKIKHLIDQDLVDGIHVDMKLPYHLLDPVEDQDIFQDVMGIKPNQQLINNLLDSIDTVIAHNSPIDQVRTVKYPILADVFFEEIRKYIETRKNYYNSGVPYFLNQFVSPE